VAGTDPQVCRFIRAFPRPWLSVQLDVRVVGVDLKIVVQGRELVSLQLLDATMGINMAPDPPPSLKGHSIRLELRIIDISMRDLQAAPPTPPHPSANTHSKTTTLPSVVGRMTAKRMVGGSNPDPVGFSIGTLLTCSCGLCGYLGRNPVEGEKTGEESQEGQMEINPSFIGLVQSAKSGCKTDGKNHESSFL